MNPRDMVSIKFTPRGVVAVNLARNADAVDITVTEYPRRTVTKRLHALSPWVPEFAAILGLSSWGRP